MELKQPLILFQDDCSEVKLNQIDKLKIATRTVHILRETSCKISNLRKGATVTIHSRIL